MTLDQLLKMIENNQGNIEIRCIHTIPLINPLTVNGKNGTEKIRETELVEAIVSGEVQYFLRKPGKGNYVRRRAETAYAIIRYNSLPYLNSSPQCL
ncbi:hypothetical protein JXB41_00515 [Candidatus Woesearchaeota archaeon]|nr:hypothetical protein [Candidatus Woesearchaeota archaeon]